MRTTLVILAALGCASAHAAGFKLESPDVKANATMDRKFEANVFGCSGENRSPALKWSGAPKGTRSFAVTVYDPDAPTGSGFWHWVVANIPAGTNMIATGASRTPRMPDQAIETRTDFGPPGYGGPCPPAGDQPHRYIFTIHALKSRIDVTPDSSGALVGFMTNANRLASASFTARYGR